MNKRVGAWSFWLGSLHIPLTCFLKLNFLSKVTPSSFSYSLSIIFEFLLVTVALEHLSLNVIRRNLPSFSFKQLSETHFATEVPSSHRLIKFSRDRWHAKIVVSLA